ncbi:D-arabinono-1,4-lactone oxidase [Silvibacterium dinghuense]|uniref:FAD-binding protein n=1 Tax=Silvibacterium dinghuense TaxID=1560006 RepID=A0A4Q1SIE7_9BACT|nr:D-arabinono-1,4-lactone oxidase [Silvibacterium dinghuense]RXS97159.1 FAD-binding protein [Silvibacterium dinghuense]GGG96705.1 xylitol oxidase [Silvibacterium dinghuense]
MNKREFLKVSGAAAAGTVVSRMLKAEKTLAAHRTNWAGNIEYSTDQLFIPSSVDEARETIRAASKIRALGARHCFNRIADSTAAQISLEKLESMELNETAKTVTVGGGVRYGKLAPWLDAKGYAVHNLASLPHVTVAGACATATHGSGNENRNLSSAVEGFELITADGQLHSFSREKDGGNRFDGMVVALGSVGVQASTTVHVVPSFQVAQKVYLDLSFDRLEHDLDAIFGSAYSVSLFTDWQQNRATQVWLKRKVEGGQIRFEDEFHGAKAATVKVHPILGHDATPCTEQLGVPGPWYERLPHFKMAFTPSSGNEIQTEYFVPREHGYEAIRAVEKLKDKITPHLFITELRTVAADDLWLSMAYRRPSLAIHFTWKPEIEAVHAVLPEIEQALAPFQPRPHWGKVFTLAPEKIDAQYPRMAEFRALAAQLDPHGKFRNAFLDREVFG